MTRKGIILAGGSGTRLRPTTLALSKHLLPVYDKPMIYYPLCTLMLAGVRDILVITTPRDQHLLVTAVGDGRKWGINISYKTQCEPRGIADAFRVGRDFIGNDPVALILGDNIFFGQGLGSRLTAAAAARHSTIFAYRVNNPNDYGVVSLDTSGNPIQIIEKPDRPVSSYAVTGLYFYDNDVVTRAEGLAPSARGELEITDINRQYLDESALSVEILGRGYAWLDAGTHSNLLRASLFVETI